MSGYPEGKHDDPADTQERLVKVGSKYQATAPSVADGDNVYLLVDAAGRILITGSAASDAVTAGNPVQVGGVVDDTSPAAAAEGDARSFRSSPEGNQIVELYKDNNALLPIAAMPGASEIKSATPGVNPTSVDKKTVLTPTSEKKIRLVSFQIGVHAGATGPDKLWIWFGAGANFATTAGKETDAVALALGDFVPLDWPTVPDLSVPSMKLWQ